MSEAKVLAALDRIERRQAAFEQAIRHIAEMLVVHNEKLDAILEAATHEPGPSPVVEALNGIVASLDEQGDLLREMPAALAVTIREELHRELEAEDIEMEEAVPGTFDRDGGEEP